MGTASPIRPPNPVQQGTVQEWDGPHRFGVILGRYVLEADPILPQESPIGGVPQGDVGKGIEVQAEKAAPAWVEYMGTNVPTFQDPGDGTGYVYIVNADATPPLVLRFTSRDEAVFYLGEQVVRGLEESTTGCSP